MKAHLAMAFLIISFQQLTFASSLTEVTEFTDIINRIQLEENTAYKVAQTSVSDSCQVFMDKDYFLGKMGKSIYTELTQNPEDYPFLLHGGTLNNYCPKYSKMSASKKASVWVLIMTVMAHFESSCADGAKAKGPNGTAYGYFQLHKGKEAGYLADSDACPTNSSTNAKLSTKCALAMLELQLRKTGGDLFNKRSYWDVLRPKGQSKKAHQISRAIGRYSVCNPVAM